MCTWYTYSQAFRSTEHRILSVHVIPYHFYVMDGSAYDGFSILVTFPEGFMNRDEFVHIKSYLTCIFGLCSSWTCWIS